MPLFQIDANLGLTATVLEMLVFSDSGIIKLLPAIPQNGKRQRQKICVAEEIFSGFYLNKMDVGLTPVMEIIFLYKLCLMLEDGTIFGDFNREKCYVEFGKQTIEKYWKS